MKSPSVMRSPGVATIGALASFLLPMVGANTFDDEDGTAKVGVFDSDQASSQGAPTSSNATSDRWMRHAVCADWITVELTGNMFSGTFEGRIPDCAEELLVYADLCGEGEVPLAPWWVSRARPDGTYGPWSQASQYQCGTDLLLAQVEQAWATMPIAPNTYDVQPSAGFAIAELGVNLIVDTNPRTLDVTLMGTPVTIRAVATQYTWTNTDGTTWTSTSPGAPFDQGGTPFVFPRTPQHRTTFTLTTTWRGEFTTNNGGTWRDAPGTATTTSNSTTVHVYNPHSHLVDCDLNGNCITGSQGGGNQNTILDPDGDGIDNYLIPDNKIDAYLNARANNTPWKDAARK